MSTAKKLSAANTNDSAWEVEQSVAERDAASDLENCAAGWRDAAGWIVVPCVHRKYGPASHGLTAEVLPGKAIVLTGVERAGYRTVMNKTTGRREVTTTPQPIRRAFRIGDTCERGSFNLVYMGTITKITAKTVTVEDHGTSYRFTLYQFATMNYDFDVDAASKRNADWMD